MASPNLKIFDYLVFKTILAQELRRDGLFLLVAGKRMILRQLVKSSPVFFNFGYSIDEIILAWEPQRDGWQGGDLEDLLFETFLQIIFNFLHFLLHKTILAWEPRRDGLFLLQLARGRLPSSSAIDHHADIEHTSNQENITKMIMMEIMTGMMQGVDDDHHSVNNNLS